MKFQELLDKTHFVTKYTNKKPKIEEISKAIIVANEGPFMAGNLQPFHFTIIEDQKSLSILAESCQKPFIANAPYAIIVTSESIQLQKLYGEKADKYLKQNVGAAIQIITLQLAESGISSSLVAPFSEEIIRNNFSIPDNIEIEMIITIGIEREKSIKRRNPFLNKKLFFGKYGNKFYKPVVKVSRKDI